MRFMRFRLSHFAAIAALTFIAGCTTQGGSEEQALESMLMGRAPRPQLSSAEFAEMQKHPLGSARNPVKAEGVAGEHEYLQRLECPDGAALGYRRLGSAADLSPYGSIMDIYEVACGAATPATVYIDMYHPNHSETRAVEGFNLKAPAGS